VWELVKERGNVRTPHGQLADALSGTPRGEAAHPIEYDRTKKEK
jgi:hypothetical protein